MPGGRDPIERQAEGTMLRRLAHEGPAGVEREARPPARPADPPGPPARDTDVLVGVLDRIAAAVEDLRDLTMGPVGEGTMARATMTAAPAAGVVLGSLLAPGQGRYRIHVAVAKDAGDVALDLALRIGPFTLTLLPTATVPIVYTFDKVHVDGGDSIDVVHPAGGAETFTVFLSATRVE